LGGCSKDVIAQPANIDFLLDLNTPENKALTKNGGFIIKNRVVVARTNSGNYIAATQVCSHDQEVKVTYRDNEFYCTEHGARFDQAGKGLNNFGNKGIAIYNTSLDGSMLRVFS
jgi:nitrite reductase/ring-hydroxylating ferredoxin subunit